ncbi:MAG: isochorismatase family cysteine hydrolase [Chloroflexota bacterium]
MKSNRLAKPVRQVRNIEIRPEETALLVVDMQKDFLEDKGKLARPHFAPKGYERKEELVSSIKKVVRLARQKKIPVIYITAVYRADYSDAPAVCVSRELEALKKGSWGAEIIDDLKPAAKDYIVEKHRYSGFYNTDLTFILETLKVKTLIFTGIATNVCVESTARDGHHRNYNIVLLSDCTRARTGEMQAAAEENIRLYFGRVLTSDELALALKTV